MSSLTLLILAYRPLVECHTCDCMNTRSREHMKRMHCHHHHRSQLISLLKDVFIIMHHHWRLFEDESVIPMVHRTSGARAPQKKCGVRASRTVHESLLFEKVKLKAEAGSRGYRQAISAYIIVPAQFVQNIRG